MTRLLGLAALIAVVMNALVAPLSAQVVQGEAIGYTTRADMLARRPAPDATGKNHDGFPYESWGEWTYYFDPAREQRLAIIRWYPSRRIPATRLTPVYGRPTAKRLSADLSPIWQYGDSVVVQFRAEDLSIDMVEFSEDVVLPRIPAAYEQLLPGFFLDLHAACLALPSAMRQGGLPLAWVDRVRQRWADSLKVSLDSDAEARLVFGLVGFEHWSAPNPQRAQCAPTRRMAARARGVARVLAQRP